MLQTVFPNVCKIIAGAEVVAHAVPLKKFR